MLITNNFPLYLNRNKKKCSLFIVAKHYFEVNCKLLKSPHLKILHSQYKAGYSALPSGSNWHESDLLPSTSKISAVETGASFLMAN